LSFAERLTSTTGRADLARYGEFRNLDP
jgi:hypothetical protein